MEDVLDLYAEPEDPKRPLVCFDECPYQLIGESRVSVPVAPGQPQRIDYEYIRNGTCNLFMMVAPKAGLRHIEVTERRTKEDFAHQMKALVDERFPDAEVIRIVMDNLNTHTPASLYEVFTPEEARRITRKLEFHFTPKHGSWLNMAEIELSVLSRQCLSRRIPNIEHVRQEINAWEAVRNDERVQIHWRFTTTDARAKLHRLYPAASS